MIFAEQTSIEWDQQGSNDQWWAWSASHGWVVLDRSYPSNRIALEPQGYRFIRCRDWTVYEQGDQPWNYQSANRRLQKLTVEEAKETVELLDQLEPELSERRMKLLRA